VLVVEFESVADHMPLIFPVAWEPAHPDRIRLTPNNATAVSFFMGDCSSAFSGLGSGAVVQDAGFVASDASNRFMPRLDGQNPSGAQRLLRL